MKKSYFTKLLVMVMVLSLVFVKSSYSKDRINLIEAKKNHVILKDPLIKQAFEAFKNFITLRYDYNASTVQDGGYVYMRDENDSLLIGSSPVVFCGNTMKNSGLSKYRVDLIGFGGLLDEMCGDLFDNIGDKKYDKIILWNAVNDINLTVRMGYSTLDDVYFKDFVYLVEKAREHLRDSSSKIYFVKMKKVAFGSDSSLTQKQVEDFNFICDYYNELIDALKFNTYEIPFDTSTDNGDGYVHYTNRSIFEDLLGNIIYR